MLFPLDMDKLFWSVSVLKVNTIENLGDGYLKALLAKTSENNPTG